MTCTAAQARRYYLHVLQGGKLKPEDVSRMVAAIETLEARVEDLEFRLAALDAE